MEVAVQWTLAFSYLELWDLIKLNQSELRSSLGQGSILCNDLNFIPCFSNWWIAPQWFRCSLDVSHRKQDACIVDPQRFKHICSEWLKTFKRAHAPFYWQLVFPLQIETIMLIYMCINLRWVSCVLTSGEEKEKSRKGKCL